MSRSLVSRVGGWSIGDYMSAPAALDDQGRHVTTREYELHPFLSGSYEIPPLTFSVRAHAGRGDGTSPDSFTLTTEPIPVEVTSLLDDQRGELTVGPIKSVVALPSSARTWLWVAGGGAALALGALGVLYVRRRRQRPAAALRYTAHELASAKLERLTERNLVERGEWKTFYREVSQILRQYIEDRFALHAPERTTEEFLREARQSAVFTTAQADTLGDFLAHCDQVKFAELTPTTTQVQRTFDTARTFIERTRDRGTTGRSRGCGLNRRRGCAFCGAPSVSAAYAAAIGGVVLSAAGAHGYRAVFVAPARRQPAAQRAPAGATAAAGAALGCARLAHRRHRPAADEPIRNARVHGGHRPGDGRRSLQQHARGDGFRG